MIQRTQSIYIALAIIALALMSIFNIASYESEKNDSKVVFNVKLSGVTFLAFEDEKATDTSEFGTFIDKAIEQRGLSKVFQIGTILLAAGICFIVFILLKFKNLKLQRNLGWFVIVLFALSGAGLLFAAGLGNEIISRSLTGHGGAVPEFITKYGTTTFLPFVAAVFMLLATISINKDMKLLKSTERLR